MITAFTTLKMAVLAPMPSASERIAVALKPGFIRIIRNACRTSRSSPSRNANVFIDLLRRARLSKLAQLKLLLGRPKSDLLQADSANARRSHAFPFGVFPLRRLINEYSDLPYEGSENAATNLLRGMNCKKVRKVTVT